MPGDCHEGVGCIGDDLGFHSVDQLDVSTWHHAILTVGVVAGVMVGMGSPLGPRCQQVRRQNSGLYFPVHSSPDSCVVVLDGNTMTGD